VTAPGLTDPKQLYQRFRARATAVSAEVYCLASRRAALEFVVETFAKEGIADQPGARAVWVGGPELHHLAARVPGLSFDVTRERAAAAKIGVTEAESAIAATGTLLGDATAAAQRLASTLPSIHIALVALANLRESLADALAQFDPRHARYLAAITGPSRTADIERVLTIGVHGPVRLIIVFYGNVEETA
jgi:L-lactate dehydrogenase complex protein LldG